MNKVLILYVRVIELSIGSQEVECHSRLCSGTMVHGDRIGGYVVEAVKVRIDWYDTSVPSLELPRPKWNSWKTLLRSNILAVGNVDATGMGLPATVGYIPQMLAFG